MSSLAEVLEWKYGLVAGTKQANPEDMSPNPKMVISYWNHPTIKQPTEAQLKKDFKEYAIYLETKKQKQKAMENEFEGLKIKSNPTNKDVMRALQLKDKLEKKDYS